MSEVMAAGSKRADGANISSWTDGKHQTSVVSTQLLNTMETDKSFVCLYSPTT